jgi:hypothetical protein
MLNDAACCTRHGIPCAMISDPTWYARHGIPCDVVWLGVRGKRGIVGQRAPNCSTIAQCTSKNSEYLCASLEFFFHS